MLEKFNEQQIELIKNCAEAIHSIENGTANQKNAEYLFCNSYFFTEPTYEHEHRIGIKDIKENKENVNNNYSKLVSLISEQYPEVHKSYLPFMVGDVLREAYETNNNEVKDNV